MTIEAIICGALAVLIVSLAYGWYSAHCEAEEHWRRSLDNWHARHKYAAALRRICWHPQRNNGSALKRIAREALGHD